jgi:hypothetical protein
VLDQDHGEAALEPGEQRDQPLGLLAAGAGHRLIEQNELRRHGERDSHLERALFAMGQRAGRHVDAIAEPDLLERRPRRAIERRLARGAADEAEARARPRLE